MIALLNKSRHQLLSQLFAYAFLEYLEKYLNLLFIHIKIDFSHGHINFISKSHFICYTLCFVFPGVNQKELTRCEFGTKKKCMPLF